MYIYVYKILRSSLTAADAMKYIVSRKNDFRIRACYTSASNAVPKIDMYLSIRYIYREREKLVYSIQRTIESAKYIKLPEILCEIRKKRQVSFTVNVDEKKKKNSFRQCVCIIYRRARVLG